MIPGDDRKSGMWPLWARLLTGVLGISAALALMLTFLIAIDSNTSLHARLHTWFPNHVALAATGVVASSGASGTWSMTIDRCHSGLRDQFRGVYLYDSHQPDLAAILSAPADGDGLINVNVPGTKRAFRFRERECDAWHVDLQGMGPHISDQNAILRGSAQIVCSLQDEPAQLKVNVDLHACGL